MSTLGWILIGVAAWLLVAVAVGMVIGRMIRLRDRQVPEPPVDTPTPQITAQNSSVRQEPGEQGPLGRP